MLIDGGEGGGRFWAHWQLWSCEETQKYSKVFSSTFYIKWDICSYVKAIGGLSYTYFTGIWVPSNLGKLGQNTQIMFKDTWKVIHRIQFHISHQLRADFYVKFLWDLSYRESLGNFGKFGQILGPRIMSRNTETVIQNPIHIAH